MYDMMKKQNFGVEIELTGITREQAANVIATYFGTQARYLGTYYKTYGATDRKGRTWKAMSDGSILTERKSASHGRVSAGTAFSCEVVTPVLQYEDMDDLQNIIRALREAGAIANSSCGIHVHVDGKNHTPASLTRLMNFAIGRQDLFYEALEIGDRANRWCKKMNSTLLKAMQNDSEKTKSSIERIWYSAATQAAREAEVKADLESYRAARRAPSAEEMAEMRAAFGGGSTVVDVLTGEKIFL